MTTETTEPAMTATRDALGSYVSRRAADLQSEYAQDKSAAVATLAHLRRAISSTGEPTARAWEVFEGMPSALIGRQDEPSPAERAAIAALSLFAVHQQSRRDMGMHRTTPSDSLGRAVATLSRSADTKGASARFRALTRASDLPSVLPHLRSLITQLRGERIPVDYEALAQDLYDLQFPGGADAVRVRWIRAFHASVRPRPGSEPTNPTPSDAETITTPTDSGDDA